MTKHNIISRLILTLVLVFGLMISLGFNAGAVGGNADAAIWGGPLFFGLAASAAELTSAQENKATLLYQGHGSLRITTVEGKVIYVDPYAGVGYDAPADLILVTHPHSDHNAVHLIETKNPGCVTITNVEALVNGEYKKFDLGYVTVEAVQAGNNPNHNINVCVGYVLTFSDGVSIYICGDTSTTTQMAELAKRNFDYAFFCCDGRYNMGLVEAAACADLVGARFSIPYHIESGALFNRELAEQFMAKNRLIVANGEVIILEPAPISTAHNYTVYLAPEKTTLKTGDTLLVDVMLSGNLNYTQVAAEIAYDAGLLEFAGYANLRGWAAGVSKSASNKVALRSVPGMNMIVGAPCPPGTRMATLKFTVKDGFAGDSIKTDLSFTKVIVSPPGGVTGTTIAPGKAVAITVIR